MRLLQLPQPIPANAPTWRERLAALGVTSFETLARLTNPFEFIARVLRLTAVDMAEALGVDVVVIELLLAGEASEVIEPVRQGLERQGFNADQIAEWYAAWLQRKGAVWAR